MRWLDRISWGVLLPITVVLALLPFAPEPHLLEKIKMLSAGELTRPLDIFDLFLHGSGLLLVFLKLIRHRAT